MPSSQSPRAAAREAASERNKIAGRARGIVEIAGVPMESNSGTE